MLFFLPLTSLGMFNSIKCLTFQHHPRLFGQILCIPPSLLVLASTLCKISFYVWACSETPCSSQQTWHFYLTSFSSGMHWSWAQRWSFNIKQLSLALLPYSALFRGTLLRKPPMRPKPALLQARAESLLCALLAVLSTSNSIISQ